MSDDAPGIDWRSPKIVCPLTTLGSIALLVLVLLYFPPIGLRGPLVILLVLAAIAAPYYCFLA